jgi:hypothetical protein
MTVVQRSPNLGLTLRMQRLPQATAPTAGGGGETPTGDVACTGWLVPRLCWAPPEALVVSALPDGRTEIHGDFYDEAAELNYGSFLGSVWSGIPVALDGLGRPRPIPGPEFLCVELEIETTYYLPYPGREFMALVPGGSWTVEWDSSTADPLVAASGHRAHVAGGTLALEILNTDGSRDDLDTLTARAFSGTVQIAELVFRARRFGF